MKDLVEGEHKKTAGRPAENWEQPDTPVIDTAESAICLHATKSERLYACVYKKSESFAFRTEEQWPFQDPGANWQVFIEIESRLLRQWNAKNRDTPLEYMLPCGRPSGRRGGVKTEFRPKEIEPSI